MIGTNIVRYDIYGPDVMIANKMESSGRVGNVQVSEDTKVLIDKYIYYDFDEEREIELKSLNRKINGYFVIKMEVEELEIEEEQE